MGTTDDPFEIALTALLDGVTPGASDAGGPLVAQLALLGDIAAAHRRVMHGDDDAPVHARDAIRWGHLELREPLGRGASGTVYRAWDTALGREVALKLFDTPAAAKSEASNEGQLLARLQHAHLVTVYGADTFDDTPGLWMELVQGETLDAIVDHTGPLSVEAALLAARDLASALAAIHDRGLLHRDVKARNVVREHGGRIVLMDLGAGRERAAAEAYDGTGTPLYMAPELFAGERASERSDLYSLGVLLYHLLSASYPVEASSLDELVRAHESHAARPLADRSPHLPAVVTGLVDRLCARVPESRPSTAREVETLVGSALSQLVEQSHPIPTRFARVWQRVAVPLAVTVSMLVLAGVAAIATWDTALTRELRWAAGLGAPSGTLFLTSQGSLNRFVAGTSTPWRPNPVSALPLAASSVDGTIATFGGSPPYEQGGAVFALDGSRTAAIATENRLCCFGDGTTDGRYNYAIRRDETRLPGSRPLAPATLYRFSRDWTNPEPLFELSPRPIYYGVTYVPDLDAFVVSVTGEPVGRLERWSRSGQREAILAEISGIVTGVAYDPADRTLWVTHDTRQATTSLLAYRLDGRPLGSVSAPTDRVFLFGAAGAEFVLPDPGSWYSRTSRRVLTWLR